MICVGGNYYNLKIVRKNNKNIYLRVGEDTITITCPSWISQDEILSFINEKSDWITKSVDKSTNKRKNSKLTIGDSIYYLGEKYRLLIFSGRPALSIMENMIVIYCKDGLIENAIKVFYKETRKTLMAMIREFEPKYLAILKDYGYNLEPEYKIRVLTSMWGVNYTKRNCITINEKLIHFEPECLEAILWHELLHFIIPNHSKRYHEVLDLHMPEYKNIVKSIY